MEAFTMSVKPSRASLKDHQWQRTRQVKNDLEDKSVTIPAAPSPPVWPRTWEFSVISEPVRSQQSGTCYACKRPVTENNINIALVTNCIKVILIGWQVNSNLLSKGSVHTSMSPVLWQSPHGQKKTLHIYPGRTFPDKTINHLKSDGLTCRIWVGYNYYLDTVSTGTQRCVDGIICITFVRKL